MKNLLLIAHAPSPNTRILRDAVIRGANGVDDAVALITKSPFETQPHHVLHAHGVILGTTENLGYMSGALKDFFDRCYYPCLEHTQGLPYALYIRAGHDGTGTKRSVKSITTGLCWREVQDPLICRGAWDDHFVDQCEELGLLFATGLEAGVF